MKTFRQFCDILSEETKKPKPSRAMSSVAQMRLVNGKAGARRMNVAGGQNFVRAAVAKKANISANRLAMLQRSKRITNQTAQKIAAAVLG